MTIKIDELEKAIDYHAKDPAWLVTAFSHKSFAKEHNLPGHNEKLEFLGDAVLDLVIADLLMSLYVTDKEGNLSRKRASIVNEDCLAQLAMDRHFPKFILLGKSEAKNGLSDNPRILASVFEAVVGAIYRDAGFAVAFAWIESAFKDLLHQGFDEHDFARDYKTRLQEAVQELYKTTPRYLVVDQTGPDHEKTFCIEVFVNSEMWARGEGNSKKAAAQDAAKKAMERLPV